MVKRGLSSLGSKTPQGNYMGIFAWRDPTVPAPTEPPPATITVPGASVVVTTTVKESITVTVSPSQVRTTITATVTPSPSPTPTPRATKTVIRTTTPKASPVPPPAAIVPTLDSSLRRPLEEWDYATPPPSVANPVSSQPQLVIQLPPTQPVASEGPGALVWTITIAAIVLVFAVLGLIIARVKKGKW